MADAPKSLVTGACGFIGTHVVEELVAAGHQVLATDLPSAYAQDDPRQGLFPGVLRRLNVPFMPADVRDRAQLAAVIQPVDYVFHVASIFNYSAPWELYRGVNVDGTRNLLELIAERSPGIRRVVIWGAGGVYGLPEWHASPLREDMPPAPTNDYQRSKWFQEHLTMQLCGQRGISWTILRPTTVYGPRQVYGFGKLLIQTAQSNPVLAPASLTGHAPMIHVRDVAGAALHLATAPGAAGEGIFHVNDDSPYSTVEIFRLVAQLAGKRFVALPLPLALLKTAARGAASLSEWIIRHRPEFKPLVERPMIEFIDADFHFDTQRLRDSGYTLRFPDAKEGLADTLRWYREQGWVK